MGTQCLVTNNGALLVAHANNFTKGGTLVVKQGGNKRKTCIGALMQI